MRPTRVATGAAFVGTSGWNYKHWREQIYPRGLAQRQWLPFIVENFDTVEVNTSFYRIPKRASVEAWAESTPSAFKFALKLWRGITHYKKLLNAAEFTASFLDVAEGMPPDRRAPLLIQLPPNQGKDLPKLEAYIQQVIEIAPSPWDIAVEFRNGAWLDMETRRSLDKLSVALCIHDMVGRGAVDEPNDAPVVYVRRHGTHEGRYAGSYSPEQIRRDAERIRAWVREGRRVYVYYNNDIGGHAFWNARDLRRDIIDVS